MMIDTRCGRKRFWTIVARYPWPKVGETLERKIEGYVEGCHKHPTKELAERCERRSPWYNHHIIVEVANGTEVVRVLTGEDRRP